MRFENTASLLGSSSSKGLGFIEAVESGVFVCES